MAFLLKQQQISGNKKTSIHQKIKTSDTDLFHPVFSWQDKIQRPVQQNECENNQRPLPAKIEQAYK